MVYTGSFIRGELYFDGRQVAMSARQMRELYGQLEPPERVRPRRRYRARPRVRRKARRAELKSMLDQLE